MSRILTKLKHKHGEELYKIMIDIYMTTPMNIVDSEKFMLMGLTASDFNATLAMAYELTNRIDFFNLINECVRLARKFQNTTNTSGGEG